MDGFKDSTRMKYMSDSGGVYNERGKRATMAEIAAEDRRMARRPSEGVSSRPTDASGRRATDAELGMTTSAKKPVGPSSVAVSKVLAGMTKPMKKATGGSVSNKPMGMLPLRTNQTDAEYNAMMARDAEFYKNQAKGPGQPPAPPTLVKGPGQPPAPPTLGKGPGQPPAPPTLGKGPGQPPAPPTLGKGPLTKDPEPPKPLPAAYKRTAADQGAIDRYAKAVGPKNGEMFAKGLDKIRQQEAINREREAFQKEIDAATPTKPTLPKSTLPKNEGYDMRPGPMAMKNGGMAKKGVPAHSDRPMIGRKASGLAVMPKGKR